MEIKIIESTLRLFKAVPVIQKAVNMLGVDEGINGKTIPLGFIFSPDVISNCTSIIDVNQFITDIQNIFGLSAEKLNNSFHKSWAKVKDTPIEQLIVEQLAHYCTTYGKGAEHEYLDEKSIQWGVEDLAEKVSDLPDFEMNKVWDNDYIYIPKEVLDIPELTDDFKLVIIKGYTEDELKVKLLNILGSGIALKEDTLKDIIEVSLFVGIDESNIASIKNKEAKCILYDKLNMLPENSTEFLRFLIYKTTGKTLIIKNPSIVAAIKENATPIIPLLFDKYIGEYGAEKLAEIFYRYKPLFLAFRIGKPLKVMINRIRRLAYKYHKPMPEDYLNTLTAKIKNEQVWGTMQLIDELGKVNIFRKIRLAYALRYRTLNTDSILYRIRNGKSYATDFKFGRNYAAENALEIVLQSIISDIKPNVKGKTIYIPDYVRYTLPATEKQFTGYFPSGTCITIPNDMVFGIHWDNVEEHRIDLDLSTLSKDTKYGWDGNYRNESGSILFSGDMTDAQKPKGASELFYVRQQTSKSLILMVNYYNFMETVEVPYKVIVAKEHVSELKMNYTVNPNSVLAIVDSKINQKQKILGLIVISPIESKFYFAETSLGNCITSGNSTYVEQGRKYLFNFYENSIGLSYVLKQAGANIINTIDENCQIDIDLTPENLEKDSIIKLLIGEGSK